MNSDRPITAAMRDKAYQDSPWEFIPRWQYKLEQFITEDERAAKAPVAKASNQSRKK